MTQEEKELLLQDLCARLPYGVFIQYHWSRKGNTIDEDRELDFSDVETLKYNIENPQNDWCGISWKPYLRLMSSMTRKEVKDLESIGGGDIGYDTNFIFFVEDEYAFDKLADIIEWLNEHHFDYRGLIEMGLALEAPEGMYKK